MPPEHVALIAEDDPSIRLLLEEVLGMRGYRTVAVADGGEVVETARAERPDVVVLDVGLPTLDGIAVLAALKGDEELAALPVVLVTGWMDAGLEERLLEGGAAAAMAKPFDLHVLGDTVDAAVAAARGQTSASSSRSIPATGTDTHSGRLSSS